MIDSDSLQIKFHKGRLLYEGSLAPSTRALLDSFRPAGESASDLDACHYRAVLDQLRKQSIPFQDLARSYNPLLPSKAPTFTPRPHQNNAMNAWLAAGGRGVVSLPTGAGKTILAVLLIHRLGRPTIVVVPTLDLVDQWHRVLSSTFEIEIGILGGGNQKILPITVATYDSALIHMPMIGNRFGFLVCDECHHLPASQYQKIAVGSIAPFRLGLSATLERSDGGEEIAYRLLGPLVYRGEISQMRGDVLSPYDVVHVPIELTPEERANYQRARSIYVQYLRRQRIDMSSPGAWRNFILLASRSAEGKEALAAYRYQKRLAEGADAKMMAIWKILQRHSKDQTIIFTNDNEFAYQIGSEFLLAVITHITKAGERQRFLQAFREGKLNVLVTSKVLNEGVDVPEASIGIIASGSGAVREHVQRLGRILRHQPEKRAILYELVSQNTGEVKTNARRRQHLAYQGAR